MISIFYNPDSEAFEYNPEKCKAYWLLHKSGCHVYPNSHIGLFNPGQAHPVEGDQQGGPNIG